MQPFPDEQCFSSKSFILLIWTHSVIGKFSKIFSDFNIHLLETHFSEHKIFDMSEILDLSLMFYGFPIKIGN